MLTKDLIIFFVGIITGAMNAIAGGGMLLGFPVMLAYGLPALVANATTNIVVLPGQIASAYGYRAYLRKTPKKYLWLLVPCALGAPIGAYILRRTPGAQFESLVPWLIVIAVGLFAVQPYVQRYLHKHMRTRSRALKPLVIIGFCLLPVAVYGGYFGAGLGFIMLAFLSFTKLHDIHQLNAMKNVAAAIMCVLSIIVLAPGTLIDWHAGIIMGAGGLIGGYGGSRLAQRVSSHAIRIFVIVIGVTTATYLGLRSY